ncbi:hypothetical protein GCM10010266_49860 [Streptomyces griseomycini]|uniref:LppU/SCO3897 family protein n=1 Tax=Streptomyces griseomycini TaxID=66895 RepID=UPI00187467CC|nr:hypothetical protein [Streptomyces griseomycini]GGQ20623.1 hypothetical protein GCM10010266_49860 [Streptomyces griseomycini]
MPGSGNRDLPEIPLTLTPQEAAEGAVVTVPSAGGDLRVAVPPVRDGDRVRVRVSGHDVMLRIRVAGPAPAVRSGPARGERAAGCVAAVAVAALLGFVGFLLNAAAQGPDDSSDAAGSAPAVSSSPDPYEDGYGTESEDPYDDPYGTEAEPPDPYTSGTCLNGDLPDSGTAQSVSGVDEVSCSAPDAHYKVIQTFPMTSDLNSCNANPRTEYAFSSRYTLNGTTVNEYVYCLVGLGSYAR